MECQTFYSDTLKNTYLEKAHNIAVNRYKRLQQDISSCPKGITQYLYFAESNVKVN